MCLVESGTHHLSKRHISNGGLGNWAMRYFELLSYPMKVLDQKKNNNIMYIVLFQKQY